MKSLYVFTGKGGVGKTSLSITFARYLKEKGKQVRYVYLKGNTPGKKWNTLLKDLDHKELNLYEEVEKYIAKKIGSTLVSSWLVKTQIFRAIFNMLPGFSYLIDLGAVLEELANNPELVVVFDSPSTGHIITMFESLENFRSIFKSGIIFDDIGKMLFFIHEKDIMKVHVVATPSQLALTEASELMLELSKHKVQDVNIVINNAISKVPKIKKEKSLPEFLQKKIEMEESVFLEMNELNKIFVPHTLKFGSDELDPFMEKLC